MLSFYLTRVCNLIDNAFYSVNYTTLHRIENSTRTVQLQTFNLQTCNHTMYFDLFYIFYLYISVSTICMDENWKLWQVPYKFEKILTTMKTKRGENLNHVRLPLRWLGMITNWGFIDRELFWSHFRASVYIY